MQQKGLPSLRDSHGQLIQQESYHKRLHDIEIENSRFSNVKGNVGGKTFLRGLENELFISYETHHLFINKSTFEKYTEVDETFRKVIKFSYPNDDKWVSLMNLLNEQKVDLETRFGQKIRF